MLLITKYRLIGDPEFLDRALESGAAAVEAAPPDHEKRGLYLANLMNTYTVKFDLTGDAADLTQAINSGRDALKISSGRSWEPGLLADLSEVMCKRAGITRGRVDLDWAVKMAQAALDRTATGDHNRFKHLSVLGNAYLARYELVGDKTDAVTASGHLRAAAGQLATKHPDLARMSSSLAASLMTLSRMSGDLAAANDAVDVARTAVAAAVAGSAEQAMCLANFGGVLRARYEMAGELADLTEAIAAATRAAEITVRPGLKNDLLSNLAVLSQARFSVTGDQADLDKAIGVIRQVIQSVRTTDSHYGGYQVALAVALWSRHRLTGKPSDLDDAIEAGRVAVRVLPDQSFDQADARHILVNSLLARLFTRPPRAWNRRQAAEILDQARAAADGVPPDHPHRVGYLLNLGVCMEVQYTVTDDRRYLPEAMACWRTATEITSAPAAERLNVAYAWGRSAEIHSMAAEAEEGLAKAVELLQLQAWRGLRQDTRETVLSRRPGMASDAAACAIANGHLEHAVELLELGRTVLWSQLLQLHGELDDLRRDHPQVARRLDALREVLDNAVSDNPQQAASRDLDEARIRAAHEWDQLLAEVRAFPGYSSFLRAPELADLLSGIGSRTVAVLNLSELRCDALIVTQAGVRLVPLPKLSLADTAHQATRFLAALTEFGSNDEAKETILKVLSWVAEVVTDPVLAALGHDRRAPDDPAPWPQVWWCPTGPLTTLPLHAAGHYGAERSLAVPDRVISSYVPTLRTLHRAQAPTSGGQPAGPDQPSVLVVAMPTTPYLEHEAPPLPGARREAAVVLGRFPEAATHYAGPNATRTAVLGALATHSYAHFACHGLLDVTEPTHSGLCLADGLLTIAALSGRELPPGAAKLAFISACHSSSPNQGLLDEAITMAAALQMAGFQHVIAAMWEIPDRLAYKVADNVYEYLSSQEPVYLPAAQALHKAIAAQRARGTHPAHWAAYIHSGS